MRNRRETLLYANRRSLQEAIAAINADCARAAEAHRRLSVLHTRRAASIVRWSGQLRLLLALL